MKHKITILTLFLLVSQSSAVAQEPASGDEFRDSDTQNWYHPIEPALWVRLGAESDVINDILSRIESAEGARKVITEPDTIIAAGLGHWATEWTKAGDQAFAEAENAGDKLLAKRKYLAATAYYLRASSPHTAQRDQVQALQKAQKSYRAAGALLPVPLQVIDIPHDGQTFKGNLHLPKGDGPFPLVVMSFGSDVSKEEATPYFERELALRGVALLMIDIPGMGDSNAWVITPDVDKLHVAAVEYAKTLPQIDKQNIFIPGASFGGLPIGRAFLARPELDLAGAIFMCGLLNRPFVLPPSAMAKFPAFTMDGVRARLGLPSDTSFDRLRVILPPFSLVNQGLMGDAAKGTIKTPLLVLTTNRDPVAPLEDIDLLTARAENARVILFDEPGHCPDRDARDAIAASWIADNLRN